MTSFPSEKGKEPAGDQGSDNEGGYYSEGYQAATRYYSPSLDSEGSNNDPCMDTYSVHMNGAAYYSNTTPEQNLPERGGSALETDYPGYHNYEQCPYHPNVCCYCYQTTPNTWTSQQPPVAGPSTGPERHSFPNPEHHYGYSFNYWQPQEPPVDVPAAQHPIPWTQTDRPASPRARSPAPKRHVCPICGHAFSKRYDLKRHYHTHVPEIERPQYTCPDCGQVFYRNDSITRHRKSQACKKGKDKEQDKEQEKRS